MPAVGISTPTLGVDVERVDTRDEHGLGQVATVNGVEYRYVKFGGTVAAKTPVAFDLGYDAVVVSGNAGIADGVSPVAFASGEWGWVAIKGAVTNVNVAAATAASAPLSLITDANGDFVTTAGAVLSVRAKALEAESGGLADVYLY